MKNIKTKEGVDLAFINIKDIPIKVNVPNSSNEITHPVNLGKLSEITEEQAKELVECTTSENDATMDGKAVTSFLLYNHRRTKDSSVVTINPIKALFSAALSVGIEEKDFDQYLVIKL
jgi:hypothetical protein